MLSCFGAARRLLSPLQWIRLIFRKKEEAKPETNNLESYQEGRLKNVQKCTNKFEPVNALFGFFGDVIKRGDIIEIVMTLNSPHHPSQTKWTKTVDPILCYQHYGVYIGNGDLVHFVRSSVVVVGEKKNSRGEVKKEKIREVVDTNLCRVNNLIDTACRLSLTPRDAKFCVVEAERYIGKHFEYDEVTSNSEHFAALFKYGEKFSEQGQLLKSHSTVVKSLDGYLDPWDN